MQMIRSMIRRISLVLFMMCAFSIFACATTYKASVSATVDKTGNVVFTVATGDNSPVPVNNFMIVGAVNGVWDYQHPLWSINCDPGSYVKVTEIPYGRAMAGFISTSAKPLVMGQHYLVSFSGAGIAEEYEFQMDEKDRKIFAKVLGHALVNPRQ